MVEIYGGNVVLQIIVLPSTAIRADSVTVLHEPGSDRSGLEMVGPITRLSFSRLSNKGAVLATLRQP